MRALLTCLCLTLCMPAMAQDEDEPFDPWGSNDEKDDETASPEDDAKEDDAKEEDAKEEDVEEPALQPEETAAEKADITEETTGPSDGNTTESDSLR